MDLQFLIAQWSGKLPPGFVPPAKLQNGLAECAHECQNCLDRRARSCRRRRDALLAEGGCRRCAYRKRVEGDFLCERCREDRNIERAQKRQDAIDAAVIDEFAAQPDRAHRASNLDLGISPWNARPKPEPSAAYWSPLPEPGAAADPGMALVADERTPAPSVLIRNPGSRRRSPVFSAIKPAAPQKLRTVDVARYVFGGGICRPICRRLSDLRDPARLVQKSQTPREVLRAS